MGSIQSNPKPVVLEGVKSQVLGVVPVEVFAFRFTNPDGRVAVSLAFCFGKDAVDGELGVFVVEPANLQSFLTPALPYLKNGIRARITQRKSTESPDLTQIEDLGEIEVE